MKKLQQKFDKSNIFEIIENLPNQFLQAFSDTKNKLTKNTQNIIFCGMGGSALPANILKTYLAQTAEKTNLNLKINRNYTLPKNIDQSWSGFFMSYSGNTEETISALRDAKTKNLKEIVVMAHGGELETIARANNYTFIKIPDFQQPRMAYGYFVGAILKLLSNSDLITLNETDLKQDIQSILLENKTLQTSAIELAKKTKKKIPIIYTTDQWKYLAMIWKINFNENSKTQSFWNAIPEMNHNEMVGFSHLLAKYHIMIIKDSSEHKQNLKRIDTLKTILQDKIEVSLIDMPEKSIFYKMVYSLSLGLYASYYLALLYRINPTPVEIVERFKKLLQK